MSDTFFKNIHISNFKSLKDVTLSDCKRINLLIGKPNVGKSNILEAIGLFGLDYFEFSSNKNLNTFIRLENLAELFFDGNKENKVSISADEHYCTIEYKKSLQKKLDNSALLTINFKKPIIIFDFESEFSSVEIKIDSKLKLNTNGTLKFSKEVKYYKFLHYLFHEKQDEESNHLSYLIPPFGINLIEVIQDNRELKKAIVDLFSEYRLKLLFDKGSNSLRIMKETKDGEVFSLPYTSIADTLQRVIFFKTAIASNENSILLFEEPEAHCFPPYIKHIAEEIIASESNQFFIATHSPFILDTFLENARSELAIYIADFKDGQTVIKRLTDNEVEDVFNYGLDLFFNAELFTDEIEH